MSDQRTELASWLEADPARRLLLSSYCQFSADLEQQLPLLAGIKDEFAGLAELVSDLRAERPEPDADWAAELDKRAAAGFRGRRRSGQRRLCRRRRR